MAWLSASGYVLTGAAAMWLLAPRVPYADGWRHLGRYLQLPFPQDVLAADNSHLELLPNLVRVVELEWLGAVQWLQVVVGMLLAASTVAMAWPAVRRLDEPVARAAGMLAVILGVYWLGNFRALVHGNESVHAYAVTLSLMVGLWCLLRHPPRPGNVGLDVRHGLVASACGLLAAFSFGSGIACFAAFGTVLLLQRSLRALAVLFAGFVVTLVLVRLAGGVAATPEFAWLRQCDLLLRWLAGPVIQAGLVLFDPDVAAQVPIAPVRTSLEALAGGYEAVFGPVMRARWPHLLVASAGLGWCAWLVVGAWRGGGDTAVGTAPGRPALLTGIGLCAFAVGTGILVAVMRLSYFQQYPDQLLAPRYLVWSSLFWAGLLLATVARARRAGRASLLVIAVAVLLLPSQAWFAKLATHMRPLAEQTAVAAAVGVLEPDLPLGETVAAELLAVLPAAREARISMFAWPEVRALGRTVPATTVLAVEGDDVDVRVVGNLLGGAARRIGFRLEGADCGRLLLVDAARVARGLAIRDPTGRDRWLGWMPGTAPSAPGVLGCAPAADTPASRVP